MRFCHSYSFLQHLLLLLFYFKPKRNELLVFQTTLRNLSLTNCDIHSFDPVTCSSSGEIRCQTCEILARPEAMKLMVYEQDYMQTTDMAQAVIQMWRFHFPRHSAFKWLWFGLFRDDYSVCVCSGWIEEALRFTLFRCTVWKMMTSFYF